MKNRLRNITPFTILVATMLAGILAATLLFRYADRATLSVPGEPVARPYSGSVTDAQKLYIAARTATSELLFKIAFATFGALIAFQLSDARRARFSERGVFAAAGLLLTSLYASFLFQIGVSHCMEASLDDMFGPILNIPILCQFWFLFIAVVVVAAALFRGPHRSAIGATIVAVLICQGAYAGTTSRRCVRDWASSRSVELSETATNDAAALVDRMMMREKLAVLESDQCAVSATMLDAVRYRVISEGKPLTGTEGGAALAEVFHSARRAAESPNLSPGELIDSLVAIAEFWSIPAGVIDIDAKKTLFVTVTDRSPQSHGSQWLRYTRCILRLPPGLYEVRVAEGTHIVFDKEVDLAPDGRVPIDAGPWP